MAGYFNIFDDDDDWNIDWDYLREEISGFIDRNVHALAFILVE